MGKKELQPKEGRGQNRSQCISYRWEREECGSMRLIVSHCGRKRLGNMSILSAAALIAAAAAAASSSCNEFCLCAIESAMWRNMDDRHYRGCSKVGLLACLPEAPGHARPRPAPGQRNHCIHCKLPHYHCITYVTQPAVQ